MTKYQSIFEADTWTYRPPVPKPAVRICEDAYSAALQSSKPEEPKLVNPSKALRNEAGAKTFAKLRRFLVSGPLTVSELSTASGMSSQRVNGNMRWAKGQKLVTEGPKRLIQRPRGDFYNSPSWKLTRKASA